MNRLSTYAICLLFFCLSGSLLLSCKNWELPGEKSQRNCTRPSGTLTVQTQQRRIDAAITGSSGTIDQVRWDFGNGSTTVTTGLTVSYTYEKEGTYTVKATLSNTCGDQVTLQQLVSAANPIPPTVTLQPVSGVSTSSATSGATVTNTGNATVTRYGICWSATNQKPTITDPTANGAGTPTINTLVPLSMTGLLENTTYYVRAFAINSAGTSYSADPVQTFRTGQKPTVSTVAATNVGITTATANFVVNTAGNPAAVEFGICYSSNTSTPDVTNSTTKVVSPAPVGPTVPVSLADLTQNKTYYYRAYAKTATGEVVYGDVMQFTTQIDLLARDLIASVSFNDRSLLDVSGNNNHVKLVGNPTFTTDHKGERANSAILLNGTGDYFYMPENSTLNPTELSISIWIKPGSFAGRTRPDNNRMQIYNKSTFSTGQNELYSSLIKQRDDVGPELTFSTDVKQNGFCQPGKGWQTFQFTSPAIINTWYHLVFTYSGRSARMYFNGVLQKTLDNLPNDRLDSCPGGDLKFGAQYFELPWYFAGAMDDIRIYKRALSADEVQALFKQ